MDEITDQFRTEDAEEFKQLQAELEIAGLLNFNSNIYMIIFLAKNCRILQFKLRKAEKRNENMEAERATMEGTSILKALVPSEESAHGHEKKRFHHETFKYSFIVL
jgi:hypothetical protein